MESPCFLTSYMYKISTVPNTSTWIVFILTYIIEKKQMTPSHEHIRAPYGNQYILLISLFPKYKFFRFASIRFANKKGSIINVGATHIRVVANILFLQ